ncbi:MAG: hypothetical protein VX738_15040, partial [Planctomycetota bacterium]|nr:hypothetical protein [Planctomycetota bacterium]
MKRTLITTVCVVMLLGHPLDAQDSKVAQKTMNDDLALLVEIIGATDAPSIRARLLRGMLDGLEGRRNLEAPPGWSEVSPVLATSENADVRRFSMELAQLFGDTEAIQRALQIIKNKEARIDTRRFMLRSLLNQQNAEASALLEALMDE